MRLQSAVFGGERNRLSLGSQSGEWHVPVRGTRIPRSRCYGRQGGALSHFLCYRVCQITDAKLIESLSFQAVAGPTYDPTPIFSWKTTPFRYSAPFSKLFSDSQNYGQARWPAGRVPLQAADSPVVGALAVCVVAHAAREKTLQMHRFLFHYWFSESNMLYRSGINEQQLHRR